VSSFTEARIVTERLELREFGPQDAAVVKALVAAGDRTSLPPGAPSQRPDVDAWLAEGVHRHRLEGGGVHLMILERASGELVGAISLFRTDWEARSSEVGYGVRPDRRGRGYASEAVAAVAQWVLAEGGMQRIQLCAVTGNLPSLRVAEKAGFRREGTLRRAQLEDDGLHDLAVFSLLDDDPARS
jgi:RimJ/RimL family protein N-acetyltransferase